MLLQRFSRIIDEGPLGAAVERRGRVLELTDPQRIYVENVRSFFHIPTWLAEKLCDLAVSKGYFSKHVGYLCPNCQAMIAEDEFDRPRSDDSELDCTTCQLMGDVEESTTAKKAMKMTFYRMLKDG